MKRQRKARKVRGTPASHNGVYRVDEMAKAFGLSKSVVNLWTTAERFVLPDYPGRSRRPSLYMEKTASVLYLVKEMLRSGLLKADIKTFMVTNKQVVYSDHPKATDLAFLDNGSVRVIVRVGRIRLEARKLLQAYVASAQKAIRQEKENEVPEKPEVKGSPVQPHHGEPVEAAVGVASL